MSVRSQNDNVAAVTVDGIETLCWTVSVDVEPLPPSHAFQLPVRAGRPVLLVIGPAVPVQLTARDSKPGLSSRLPPVGGGVVQPSHFSVPTGTEMALNAASTDLQVWLVAP